MKPEEELIRAEKARQVLEDKIVREALDGIKNAIIEGWRQSPVKDVEHREKLWSIYVGACKFEELLRSYIETGKLARAQLDLNDKRGR